MNKCIECSKETKNPKFCSRSCSAKTNNRLAPKRYKTNSCKTCGVLIWKGRTYCKCCWNDHRKFSWKQKTLGELNKEGSNKGGYPMIREHSRRTYLQSDKPKYCIICKYDLHFDVAHIKGISSFPDDALISEINSLDNLTALCKNHHWEYDNGHLEIH